MLRIYCLVEENRMKNGKKNFNKLYIFHAFCRFLGFFFVKYSGLFDWWCVYKIGSFNITFKILPFSSTWSNLSLLRANCGDGLGETLGDCLGDDDGDVLDDVISSPLRGIPKWPLPSSRYLLLLLLSLMVVLLLFNAGVDVVSLSGAIPNAARLAARRSLFIKNIINISL